MTGARLKGCARGTRILQHLPDSALEGKQSVLARKYGVVESVISKEREARGLGVVSISPPFRKSDSLRLRESRHRIYELHFVVGKSPEEIAQLMNFSEHDVRVLIGKMRL